MFKIDLILVDCNNFIYSCAVIVLPQETKIMLKDLTKKQETAPNLLRLQLG